MFVKLTYLFLNLSIISSKQSTKYLTSSKVLSLPNVILKLPLANCGEIPIAKRTCDGFIKPALQAEPLELHIPSFI